MFQALHRAYRLYSSDSSAETVIAFALVGVVAFVLLNQRR